VIPKQLPIFATALLSLCLFSEAAWGNCTTTSCFDARIQKIYIADSGVYVTIDKNISPLSCSPVGGQYLTLRDSHGNRDLIYSALLAGKSTNKPFAIRIAVNSGDCRIIYVVADN